MAINSTILSLFILTIATNIIGPVNLKVMSQLDIHKEILIFLGLAAFHLLIVGTRMITWFKILKRIRLSIAYPVISVTFPLMLVISYGFFDENITIIKLAGTALIISGILINQYSND
jgi:drug/metabolite transporter (DMT)-like permease